MEEQIGEKSGRDADGQIYRGLDECPETDPQVTFVGGCHLQCLCLHLGMARIRAFSTCVRVKGDSTGRTTGHSRNQSRDFLTDEECVVDVPRIVTNVALAVWEDKDPRTNMFVERDCSHS